MPPYAQSHSHDWLAQLLAGEFGRRTRESNPHRFLHGLVFKTSAANQHLTYPPKCGVLTKNFTVSFRKSCFSLSGLTQLSIYLRLSESNGTCRRALAGIEPALLYQQQSRYAILYQAQRKEAKTLCLQRESKPFEHKKPALPELAC